MVVDSGPSRNKIKEFTKEELARFDNFAPWTRDNNVSQWRSPYRGLALLVSDHLDADCVSGYSYFHYKLINQEDIEIATTEIACAWGIESGSRYYIWDYPLRTGVKGDDGKMDNWPQDANVVSLLFVFAFLWNCGLAHCKFSAMCTLISGEGCHSDLVTSQVKFQVREMKNNDKLVVWSNKANCYCCYNLKFYFCSDWIFECAIFGLTGPTSKCFLHGLTKLVKGKPELLGDDFKSLWDAFESGIDPCFFDVDLQECIDNEIDGYCLTNNEILQYYGTKWNKRVHKSNRRRKGALTIDKKRQIAHETRTGLLKHPSDWYYCLLSESFHCFDTYVCHIVKYTIFLCHCAFDWPQSQTLFVVEELGE